MRPTSLVESGRGPTKALPRPHIAILNIVGVIALLDELVVRGSVRAREGFVLRSAELQPAYVAMSFFFSIFFILRAVLYPKQDMRRCGGQDSAGVVCLSLVFF